MQASAFLSSAPTSVAGALFSRWLAGWRRLASVPHQKFLGALSLM